MFLATCFITHLTTVNKVLFLVDDHRFPKRALLLLENPQTSLLLSSVSKERAGLEHWRQTQRPLGYISVELRVLPAVTDAAVDMSSPNVPSATG